MPGAASTSDPWSDYDTLYHTIPHMTIDRLKQVIYGLNNESAPGGLAKTGRKQDLIDRVRGALARLKEDRDVERWTRARTIMYQVKTSGMYTPPKPAPYPDYAATSSSRANGYHPMTAAMVPKTVTYANPHLPAPTLSHAPAAPVRPPLAFKPSPFHRVDQHVSQVVEGPESTSSSDRRQATLLFTLTEEQQAKLKSSNPKYQLRLYCTSSSYHTPSSYRATTEMCPIEFPPTCEIRVNGTALNANTKGLKKKPGTAPPCDLGKTVKPAAQNRVEMVYINSNASSAAGQAGSAPKKYYIVVILVEMTSVDQLVDRLKKGKYRDSESILSAMRKAAADDDDDIVAGPQKMSLRDSLTMLRVGTPARSNKCVHPSCFDARTWFELMEATTTWQCPICEKVLDPNELFVDGYFESIIKATPEDCDDVMVEADGEWHTADNKYASFAWRAAHPPPVPALKKRSPTPVRPAAAVYVLEDSDDEDEGRVKRELSPSYGGGWGAPSSAGGSVATLPPASQLPVGSASGVGIIDLTLDSDDDDDDDGPPPPTPAHVHAPTPAPRAMSAVQCYLPPLAYPLPANPSQKRKSAGDERDGGGDGAWKRPRQHSPYASTHGSANGHMTSPLLPYASGAYAHAMRAGPSSAYHRPTPTSSNSSQQASNGINYRYQY